MGGSGSSYTPRNKKTDCSDLAFDTVVNSPDNLGEVKVGDILELKKTPKLEILFIHSSGSQIGKLFSSSLLSLISCMDKGFEYSAEVKELKRDVCRVYVWCTKTPRA